MLINCDHISPSEMVYVLKFDARRTCACVRIRLCMYIHLTSVRSYLFDDKSILPSACDDAPERRTRLAMYEHTSKGRALHCRSFIGSSTRVRFDGGLPTFGLASLKRLRRTSLMEIGTVFHEVEKEETRNVRGKTVLPRNDRLQFPSTVSHRSIFLTGLTLFHERNRSALQYKRNIFFPENYSEKQK